MTAKSLLNYIFSSYFKEIKTENDFLIKTLGIHTNFVTQNTTFHDISANPSFLHYKLYKDIQIFCTIQIYIVHSMNNIRYSIQSIFLR